MESYNEGWNAAIMEVVRRIEMERDHAYAMEKWAKKKELNGSPHGYRADGLRDIADIVRPLLQNQHLPMPTDEWSEPIFPPQ